MKREAKWIVQFKETNETRPEIRESHSEKNSQGYLGIYSKDRNYVIVFFLSVRLVLFVHKHFSKINTAFNY